MADSHHKIRGYLRQNGETNMQKYNLDVIVGLTNWGYTIEKPTTAMLSAVPQEHIDFVSKDYYTRDIYTATGTLSTKVYKNLPIIAARFPCITLQTAADTVTLDCGFWKLTISGASNGDTSIRIIDWLIDISSSQFNATRIICISSQTSFQVEAKKRSTVTTPDVELNITLLIEEL